MRNIFFYPASRQMNPHYDDEGTLHLPMSEWDNVICWTQKGYGERKRFPEYPTNGSSQPSQS